MRSEVPLHFDSSSTNGRSSIPDHDTYRFVARRVHRCWSYPTLLSATPLKDTHTNTTGAHCDHPHLVQRSPAAPFKALCLTRVTDIQSARE